MQNLEYIVPTVLIPLTLAVIYGGILSAPSQQVTRKTAKHKRSSAAEEMDFYPVLPSKRV